MAQKDSAESNIFKQSTNVIELLLRNIEDKNLAMSPPPAKRMRLLFDDEENQQLGFRKSFLYYFKKNAKPKLLLKLMQATKFFCYKEFPFMVVKDLKLENNKWKYRRLGNRDTYHKLVYHKTKKPLWIVTPITVYPKRKLKFFSRLLSKTAFCEIEKFQILRQNIPFDKFKRLYASKKIRIFKVRSSYFSQGWGETATVDEIAELLSNVEIFDWHFYRSTISEEKTKKLVANLNPSILKSLSLKDIPEAFDFILFAKFMDDNPSISFALSFYKTISAAYAEALQNFVDKLIETGAYKSRPICIIFPGQTKESQNILC